MFFFWGRFHPCNPRWGRLIIHTAELKNEGGEIVEERKGQNRRRTGRSRNELEARGDEREGGGRETMGNQRKKGKIARPAGNEPTPTQAELPEGGRGTTVD